jgi:hypothetical protein
LLLHASHAALPILNSSELSPVVDAADYVFSKLSIKIRNSKFYCLKPSSITITSSPSHYSYQKDERGVAWEPSNKIIILLPPRKNGLSLTSSLDFLFESTLHLSFPSLSLSLGFCFKGLRE